ncbi:E3 ubiquitin protein ligase [Tanacetum coccineum]
MGSLKDPKTWIPHINPKDCSKKVCNIYCTKWCKYVIQSSPPPPPPPPLVKDGLGGTFVSPVVIVIVALIGTLLLLIGYYVIISRYCSRNNGSSMMVTRVVENQETHDHEVGVHGHADHVDEHANYVPWLVLGKGLDEALIKSITICKYKRGDGLVSCTDCSVCLGEFRENESLRLLPKCCHAFHVTCIDTWFKTHSNCPLCRANVCFEVKDSSLISPSTPPPPPPPPMTNESSRRDVRDEGERKITRSKSMDHYLCQTRVSTPKVMFFDQAKNMVQEEVGFQADAGSSRNVSKGNNIVNVSHFGMKRSYSSRRYSFTRECV